MLETKDFKSKLKSIGQYFKLWFKSPKKQLDQSTVEKEVEEFLRTHKEYDLNDHNFDVERFQNSFIEYLKDKNYSFEGLDASLVNSEDSDEVSVAPKKIRKISEDLNDTAMHLSVFVDTTKMMPGLVCYTIEKVDPTIKRPYATYRPDACVIAEIHDSGVNGGTLFFTYKHNFIHDGNFNSEYRVDSDYKVIYTPLTKEHADYVCKLLNLQSRTLYKKKIKEALLKKQAIAQQKNQKTR